jgi:ABC-type multidrug transport system ATPase subunit
MYGDMTLRENLQIYWQMFGAGWTSSILNRISFSDAIEPILDLPVAQLSGGTYKLAALACILALEPNALLLDEPASELDSDHAAELYSELKDLSKRLRFVVVSTHDVRGLEFLDRKVELDDGKIV